jgi:hypothetical protein
MYRQDPPNAGTVAIGRKSRYNVDADNGFDIGGNSAIAYALLKDNANAIYTIKFNYC